MLAPEGFRLLTAASGEKTLTMVAQQRPDLILLDVLMPGMDGYQVMTPRGYSHNMPIRSIWS